MTAPEGLDTSLLLVQEMVMEQAQQHEVVGLRLDEIEPVDGVVGVARPGGNAAAGRAAAVITDQQRVEQRVGNDPLGAPVVGDGADRVGDVPVDVDVTGKAPDRFGRSIPQLPVGPLPLPPPAHLEPLGLTPAPDGHVRRRDHPDRTVENH